MEHEHETKIKHKGRPIYYTHTAAPVILKHLDAGHI